MLSKDHSLIYLIVIMQCLKALVQDTRYLTPCNVPHECFVFLHPVLLSDLVDYIFPTSKCRYVFFIANIRRLNL